VAKGRTRRPSKRKGRRSISLADLYMTASKVSTPLTIAVLIAVLAVGVYLRLLPAIHYRLELDASDPWIEYWMAEYFHNHGLFSFSGLKDVKVFWYPEGRNFLSSARLGLPWLAAATYPIVEKFGLTLREWVALIPPIAAAFGVIIVFFFVYRLTGSKLGGLVAATLYSLTPGAIVRTTVGFVEKIGVAFPVLVLFLWLALEAYRSASTRKRLTLSILSGITGGFVGFLWGGYAVAIGLVVLAAVIDPFLRKPNEKDLLTLYLPTSLAMYFTLSLDPSFGLLFIKRIFGLLIISAPIVYGLSLLLYRILGGTYNWKIQAWLITALLIIVASAVASGYTGLGGRALAALGVKKVSPLVESVQEHMPAPWSSIFREYGIALILTLAGIVAILYKVATGSLRSFEGALMLAVFIASILLMYANKNMSYFTEMAASFNALSAGIFTGLFGGGEEVRGHKKRKKQALRVDELKASMALTIVIIVIAGTAFSLNTAYAMNAYKAPAIMTSMLGSLELRKGNKTVIVAPINYAWINALKYIKEHTPPNALIVSWWDYGYWITVNTGRPTVADGATLNETQIRLLARLLTGTEDGASAILKEYFNAKPNETYIVFYDVFYAIYDNGTLRILPVPSVHRVNDTDVFIVHGEGDLPKSFQMLRIGYRINPFAPTPFGTNYSTTVYRAGVAYHHFPGFVGIPKAYKELVYNTLLYKLMVYGLYSLNRGFNRFIIDNGCKTILSRINNTHPLVLPSVLQTEDTVAMLEPVKLHRFALVNMSIGCPTDAADVRGSYARILAVIVFIYKWTG